MPARETPVPAPLAERLEKSASTKESAKIVAEALGMGAKALGAVDLESAARRPSPSSPRRDAPEFRGGRGAFGTPRGVRGKTREILEAAIRHFDARREGAAEKASENWWT